VRLVWLFVLVSLAACDDDGPFADPANPTREECDAIEARWVAAADTIHRWCEVDDDCVVIGGGDCEARWESIGPCDGTPLNRAAYESSRARLEDAAEGWGRCDCDVLFCTADCQLGTPRCASGVCVVEPDVCNPPQR
jgi:hypothetical protein